ncbi:C1QL [Mytilus edulis]|uniref:C1QL n=1 Tax=Mytilus edulis TaxID=6550 RepID=A0A8S3S4Z0_MYTED|nr:C1QL [Mytilus edulis]
MIEIESRFFKDVKNVETNILELVKDLKVEMNERESQFNREVNTLNGSIQVFSTEKDNKIIRIKNEIENVINEKENANIEEMTEMKEKMFILQTKTIFSLVTLRADYKLSIRKSNNRCMNSIYRMKTEKRPAFSATFTNERAIPLTHGEILKFDNIHITFGEGYDPATGYFTVPKAGIYFVSCTVRSIENKHIHAYLWKNTDRLLLAYGRNWNTGNFSFPINLQKGGSTLCET